MAMPKWLSAGEKKQARKPNIVLILADDLGYGDLSSYGAKDLKTPHIDNLVAKGMRFDNFYANCPVCSPTRASLLTGRYPDLVGVPGVIRTHLRNNWGYLAPQAVLLPKLLNRAGYHTAIVGKWHLGLESPNVPNERGFDHFHGYLGDMMDDYYNHRRHGINYMRLHGKEINPKGHATDLFSQWAIDYIKDRFRLEQPFFLYLAYNAPHTPIQPPKDWFNKVKKREKNISDKRAKLTALIEHMDDGIGKVIALLKDNGLDKNTLIIFTSDNGGQLNVGANNGPLRAGKQDMYEGGIRVPMCAVWPGKIKAGSRSDRVALTMDLFPTICEAVGASLDYEIDGRSILWALLGKSQPAEERYLFWVRREGGGYGGRAYYAARYGDFKLVQNSPFEPLQLYNLKDDPKEQNPLERRNPMYNKLFTALRNHIIEAGAVPWEKYPVKLSS
ncbi:MAG: sulfatase-like hydrolase/transferase [Planctomycetes bacterium]|nr:sulfatase-like hydrolase/transferase [Planctomycetota bacterium]